MKTLFLGTPAMAVPFLEKLHELTSVVGVVTNPDQPAGRGYEIKASEVKQAAMRFKLPVLQPEKAKDERFIAQIAALQVEVGIAVAYGKLLPAALLKIPKFGFLNVHFSLLPAYRGAAPIQWALIHGEKETGVTIFWLDEGMDTGPLCLQKKIAIEPEDNADTLRAKLIPLGVQALTEVIEQLKRGQKVAVAQTGPSSHAAMLKKEDGHIEWNQKAEVLWNRIRGLTPWPGAFCFVANGNSKARLKVLKCRLYQGNMSGPTGSVVGVKSGTSFIVRCQEGAMEILEVQPEGKKPMSAWAWWQGSRLKIGDSLESL